VISEQLEESLRREIDAYVEQRLSTIKQEIVQLQNQLNETLKHLLENEGADQWDGSFAASIGEHLRAAHERGVELAASESSRTQASSDMAIVKAAIEEIEGHHSQAEILKALVNRASSFAPRVAFFVIKSEQARGWRSRGFQGTVGDEAVQQITFPLLADTVIGEVARSRAPWSGTPNSHSEDHMILNRLGEQPPQRIVAVPLVVRGKTVAALYADSAGLDSDAINLEALETLVRVAGMAVGLLSVSHAAAAKPQPEPAPKPEPDVAETPAYTPEREYEETPAAEASAGTVPEQVPATEPVAALVPQSVAEPVAALVPQSVAEPVAEPEEVEQAASLLPPLAAPVAEPTTAPVAGRRRYGTYDAELPVSIADEEEKRQHNDARRFARLLVSEIKLYNEQKVIEGRSEGNLYQRLREYIDRSREMYDKRVRPDISAKYDYFHHELVNTLAEGDASKLGEAYPGTTVSA
jgi:GAF domain